MTRTNDDRKKLDVVHSREREEVVDVLKRFTFIETVSRDFSKTYRAAISQACPKAKQIVDRFHILKNLTDDISEYMKRTIKDKIKMVELLAPMDHQKEILNAREKAKLVTSQRKWETIKEVQRLDREGINHNQIAKKMNLSRPTVINHLNMTTPPIRSTACILDPWISRIKELIVSGYCNMEIYKKIKEEGYEGQISLYNSKMKGIRQEVKNGTHYLKRSQIKKLLYKPIEEIKDKQTRMDIENYLDKNQELRGLIQLVVDFKKVLKSKRTEGLMEWIHRATKWDIIELNRFIKLLMGDIEAVKNAILYEYSNGLTEGFNNRPLRKLKN